MKYLKKPKNKFLFGLILIAILLIMLRIPYFIPNTPEYTMRKYLNTFVENDAKKNYPFNYWSVIWNQNNEEKILEYGPNMKFSFLISAKKSKLSDEALKRYVMDLNDGGKLDLYETDDILFYKTKVAIIFDEEYVRKVGSERPIKSVLLVKNKFDDGRAKWLWYEGSMSDDDGVKVVLNLDP